MKSINKANPIISWLRAFRLRTLPLSLSTITLGNALAYYVCSNFFQESDRICFSWLVFGLALLTTLLLQILSNLANDYGDSQKGADNENRIGPARTVQSGLIGSATMKKAIILFSVLSFVAGIALVFFGLRGEFNLSFFIFILLGLAAIAAAIKYTVGKSAYGYRGLGDLFVFLFFGLLGVGGSFALQFGIDFFALIRILLPAIAMGLLSTGVLNLNNMRDIENDLAVGKITLAARLGLKKAKIYHTFLIVGAILCSLVFTFLMTDLSQNWIWLLSLPILLLHLKTVHSINENRLFDPLLKQLALGSAFWASLFSVGLVL